MLVEGSLRTEGMILTVTDRQQELLLPPAEFAYNHAPSRTTNESPFKVIYGQNPQNPLGPIDLVPLHQEEKMNIEASKRVKEIQELHKRVQVQIEKENERYQDQANKHRKQALFNRVIKCGCTLERRDFIPKGSPN